MLTIYRFETRSLAIPAPPDAVHAYLSDANNLPAWAPAFATTVRSDGDSWVVKREEQEFTIDVLVEPIAGTVDIVSSGDNRRGLFTRVVPNGDGSQLLFTLFFHAETPEDAVQAQKRTLDAELAAVRDACAASES